MAFQDMAQHTWVWTGQEETDCQGHQLHSLAQGLHLCWDLGACPLPISSSDSRAQEKIKSLENEASTFTVSSGPRSAAQGTSGA